jgi:transcription antitermination factor NusG
MPQIRSEAEDAGTLWYAACTLARHEKAVAHRLARQEIQTYVPLYWTTHCWNHRLARVELPLIPGYVFVKMPIADKTRILADPGVIRFVGFNGKAAAIPEDEVEMLRSSLAICKAEPYPFLAAGKRVHIRSGPLAGLVGKVLRRKNKMKVVISIDCIQRSVLFELDAGETLLAG